MGDGPKPTEPQGFGTVQLRAGQKPEQAAAPAMATVTGGGPMGSAPPAMPPARYELKTEIARGGMGRVVEAIDTTLGRIVAVKEALADDGDALKRFARETKITARLEHPSIVPVHDAGVGPNGMPYYVMRKIGGRPLETLVMHATSVEERLALVPHVVQAAQAIAHAHERGIVHRDIKPSNILVGDLGETIVIDWGLAKVIGEADDDPMAPHGLVGGTSDLDSIKTRVGIVYGTPGFMAPEQLRGAPVDPKFDVYALGATLYHLLSRKPPHHAKTADEMMRAAVSAPPTPIRELVQGVPAELSTIIDKALAHDPTQRYQDARALAEDLQRFISGQLVASHHYTPRERLARWVKKHRIAVGVAAAAALTLLVGGAIAVVRIRDQRDRADAAAVVAREEKLLAEQNLALAQERADQLTLSQAWMIADTNPTLAIAMIKALAAKPLWREVLPVAARARAAGVAWSLPASPTTRSLEMSRAGRVALAAGDDGVVRLYDLDRRTTRTIDEVGEPVEARFADDERKIVLWRDRRITVHDMVTSEKRELTASAPIASLDVVGITAYWTDTNGGLWQLDLAGTVPLELAMDEKIERLSASPDGRWLALAGEAHLFLRDRTDPAAPPLEVTTAQTRALDWSTDGLHLAALVDEYVIDVRMSPSPAIVQRLHVGTRSHVAFSQDRVYTVGPTGLGLVSRDGSRVRRPMSGAVGLYEARGDTIVAATDKGVHIVADRGDHFVGVPSGRLRRASASPRSPYVLGALDGRLLVWNLDEVQPRALAGGVTDADFAGHDAVFATAFDDADRRIDLATGKVETHDYQTTLASVASNPGGSAAAVVDLAHKARLLVPGKEPVDLGDHTDFVGFAGEGHVVLGSKTGSLQVHDIAAGKRSPLVERPHPLEGVAWTRTSPAYVAGVWRDGTVWRVHLGTRAETTRKLPELPRSLHLLADGTLAYAVGNELRLWTVDDRVRTQARLAVEIAEIGEAGPRHLVAFTKAGAAHLVELATPNKTVDLEQSFTTAISMAADTGLIVETKEGRIDVVDALVKARRWTLAATPGITYAKAKVSTDGRWVIARTGGTLVAWNVALPKTSAETMIWLDAMTNAVADSGAASFGWK